MLINSFKVCDHLGNCHLLAFLLLSHIWKQWAVGALQWEDVHTSLSTCLRPFSSWRFCLDRPAHLQMSGGLSIASPPAWLPKSQVFLTFLSPGLGQLQGVLHECISAVPLSSTGTGSSVLGISALLADIQTKSAVSKGDPVTAQQIPLMQDCSGNQTESSYPQFFAITPR